MDSDFAAALEALRLGSSIQQRLVDFGVTSKEDLRYIRYDDLQKEGFNLVQQRKIMSLCDVAWTIQKKDSGEIDKKLEGTVDSLDSLPPMAGTVSMLHHEESDVTDTGEVEDECKDESDDPLVKLTRSCRLRKLRRDSTKLMNEGTHLGVQERKSGKLRRKGSLFWHAQRQRRPMRLIFIRHGESEANVNRKLTQVVPDHALHLTAEGRRQALDAGARLRSIVTNEKMRFCVSPYVRTRETMNGILNAWDLSEWQRGWVREDVRLREQEYGNYDSPDIKKFHSLKKKFGPFYYRFPEGESIADCFDRASLYVEHLYRSWNDNLAQNHVIVGHGAMILVTLCRLLRIPAHEFDSLDSLGNCEFVVLERPVDDAKFNISYTWCEGKPKDFQGGLRRKPHAAQQIEIWSGDPEDPLLTSQGEANVSSS